MADNRTLDELRQYAERTAQEHGFATVIIAIGGEVFEFVVSPAALMQYIDDPTGALVEAIRQRQEAIR